MSTARERFLSGRQHAGQPAPKLAGPFPSPKVTMIPLVPGTTTSVARRVVLHDFANELVKVLDNAEHINDLTLVSSCRSHYVNFVQDELGVGFADVAAIQMRLSMRAVSVEMVLDLKDGTSRTFIIELEEPEEFARALAKATFTSAEHGDTKVWCGNQATVIESMYLKRCCATALKIEV